MQEVQLTIPIGTIIQGRYQVEGLLGRGGFGAVYLVRDRRVRQNLYALKEVVDPNRRERKRFLFEAELLERLDHPALPRVYRVFEDEQNARAFMLMNYVDGPNLQVLRRQQPGMRFALSQVLSIMQPIIQAVGYLHAQRPPILHRDIKPSNIIVPSSGEGAVLVDFGIAKVYDPETTTTAVRHCSPGYGAPEQYGTGTNTRTDIYGLGATIYALLSGIVPVDALFRITQMGSKGTDPLEPLDELLPELPKHIADAIHRAMALDAEERFLTTEEFWQALNAEPIPPPQTPLPVEAPMALAAPQPTITTKPINDATKISVVQKQQHRNRRRVGAALLALLAFLLAFASATGLLYMVMHPGHQSATTPAATHKATAGPSHSATASAGATPTVTTVAGYPSVAGSSAGSITDQFTSPPTTAPMSLVIQQKQGQAQISGQFTTQYPLEGSGPFTGTVSTNNKIRFLVAGYGGNPPLFFTGTIQPGGVLSGNYCSVDYGTHCNFAMGGHGYWSATLRSSGSSSTPGPGSFVPVDTPRPVFVA